MEGSAAWPTNRVIAAPESRGEVEAVRAILHKGAAVPPSNAGSLTEKSQTPGTTWAKTLKVQRCYYHFGDVVVNPSGIRSS